MSTAKRHGGRHLQTARSGASRKRLLFASIDVIGTYFTEIKISSPTGILELGHNCDLNIANDLAEANENQLHKRDLNYEARKSWQIEKHLGTAYELGHGTL